MAFCAKMNFLFSFDGKLVEFMAHPLCFLRFLLCFLCLWDMVSARVQFYTPSSDTLQYDERIEQAEAFLTSFLYEKAIPIYQSVISDLDIKGNEESLNGSLRAYLHFRLGQAHFFSHHYQEAVQHFEQPGLSACCKDALFFAGISYTHLARYPSAAASFENYLKQPERQLENEARFELGLAYFHLKQWNLSTEYLSSIPYQKKQPRLFLLSRFYLARIALLQSDYLKAEERLNEAAPYLESSGLLEHEWAYLNGDLYFLWKDYQKAADWYEVALPKNGLTGTGWSVDALSKLGTAALHAAENTFNSPDKLKHYLDKAEGVFKTLTAISSDEKAYIALAQCYLAKARFLNDSNACGLAGQLLSKPQALFSRDAQSQVLLMRAQAGATYSARDLLYRQLTQEILEGSPTYAKGWLLRGLNDFEEAQTLRLQKRSIESAALFERSISALNTAFRLLWQNDAKNAGLALKTQAYAFIYLETPKDKMAAFQLLSHLTDQSPHFLEWMPDPDEIFYLKGLTAYQLAQMEMKEEFKNEAITALKNGLDTYPQKKFSDQMRYLLGVIFFHSQDYPSAWENFSLLASDYPNSSLKGNALFWKAKILEQTKPNSPEEKELKRRVFEEFPTCPYAAESYFTLFSYGDYLQGERSAIKHLNAFPERFSNTPFLLNAFYLIGLDSKRDRKTPEGKWISKKNLTSAIDAFQQCETTFDRLYQEGSLPLEKMAYYTAIRTRATLERALANLAIAEESQGAKRQIYFEYAEEVLRDIHRDFAHSDQSLAKYLIQENPYSPYQEESTYWLAQCCLKQGRQQDAIDVFEQMLEKYRSARITKGYFLSKVCYNLGQIAMDQRDYPRALESFLRSEDAAKGKIISTDEKLDLWIQQSRCYQELNQLDDAILILSKVVNDDAISSLRIKAMYLRADTYALQGRRELARKQLEATSKKGGEWGLKAKQKLDQEYGYQ